MSWTLGFPFSMSGSRKYSPQMLDCWLLLRLPTPASFRGISVWIKQPPREKKVQLRGLGV